LQTNPGPLGRDVVAGGCKSLNFLFLETILSKDPRIEAALMFGRGRFQNGVIITPKQEYAFDPTDQEKLVAFRKAIWPTVERMNAYAPQHSRLFKEVS
jgi:hypothetical protein